MKKNFTIDPKLEAFLKKHRVYRKFVKNTIASLGKFYTGHVIGLRTAFVWDDTPEEAEFWLDLDEKFENN